MHIFHLGMHFFLGGPVVKTVTKPSVQRNFGHFGSVSRERVSANSGRIVGVIQCIVIVFRRREQWCAKHAENVPFRQSSARLQSK